MRDFRLITSSVRRTRQSLSRLARRVQDGTEDDYAKARLVHDLLKTIVQAHKIEFDTGIQEQIDALKKQIGQIQSEDNHGKKNIRDRVQPST